MKSLVSATRSLRRYPTPFDLAATSSVAYCSSTYCDRTMTAVSGCLSRTASAATIPSEVKVGGIRTSTTTRSGRCSSTASMKLSASGQAAATSKPADVSRRTIPSRSRTESSASTTLVAGWVVSSWTVSSVMTGSVRCEGGGSR